MSEKKPQFGLLGLFWTVTVGTVIAWSVVVFERAAREYESDQGVRPTPSFPLFGLFIGLAASCIVTAIAMKFAPKRMEPMTPYVVGAVILSLAIVVILILQVRLG